MAITNLPQQHNKLPFVFEVQLDHVTASVKKLLARIVNVDDGNGLGAGSNPSSNVVDLVDLAGHSYGITSDPSTQFAVVFSALIHDTRCAQIYRNKSVAEQKSVDIAWDMLMSEDYAARRACIYQTEEDLQRFRQLVLNTVMATDTVDSELQAFRKARWDSLFQHQFGSGIVVMRMMVVLKERIERPPL
eukprot:scaffold4045_cov62-Cylindrotheca_fusiformis.AAC.1